MRKPKATAAELRNKARMSMPCVCEDYCRCDVTTVVDDDALDEILAAARAEAVAPLEARVRELERDLALMTHSRDGFREAVIAGEGTRARAADLEAVLRQLVEAMPPCTAVVDVHTGARCGKPATRAYGRGGARYCDDHGCHTGGLIGQVHEPPDYPRAAPLRLALALLAADQAGEKAGKP